MTRYNKLDVLGILQEHGAIMEGHFRLPSGLHTSTYIQTAVVTQYPHLVQRIAASLNRKFPSSSVDVVASPAAGGLVIGQEVARQRKCRSIFFERSEGVMGLRRLFKLERRERVLIVEDVLTSGRSIGEVLSLCAVYGAKPVGVGVIVDRSVTPMPFSVPVRDLLTMPVEMTPPEHCELCAQQVPIRDIR